MRNIIYFLSILFLNGSLEAQSWEIFNTELKAEKKGEELLISFLDGHKTLNVLADSAFWDSEFEYLFIVKNGKLGVVDSWELELIQEPEFLSVNILDGVYYLAEDQEGYYFSMPEFPLSPISERFESVSRLFERSEISQGEEEPYIIKLKGKYGILVPYMGFENYLVKAKYDEIIADDFLGRGQIYYMRKDTKWGAGSCEGIEIGVKYDKLSFLKGDCGDACYRVLKDGLQGMMESFNKKPVVDIKYSRVESLKKGNSEYLLLFEEGTLSRLLKYEGSNEWFTEFEPLMILKFGEAGGCFLVYKDENELSSLKLSEEELERLGLQSIEWLIIEN